jgi:7-carboxy-7-deazaguanine synthase
LAINCNFVGKNLRILDITLSDTEQLLPVMEAFYTIQGEGSFAGTAAYFIRLGGCDVGCHWCDVKESWDQHLHPKLSIVQISQKVSSVGAQMAVVTGGEPLMHNLQQLTAQLNALGIRTNIETSGVCEQVTGQWDWICFSPKKFKKPNPQIYSLANELKVIIYNQTDFEFAEQHAIQVNSNCVLFLQPEWSRQTEMLPHIVAYVKENPQWKISLQTHKFMDIP